MPSRSAVLVRLPPQASKARWIARRSTSASRARSGRDSTGSPAAGIAGSSGSSASRCSGRIGPAPRGDHRPCQGVLQLPDVARPGSFPDRREGLGGERKLAPAVPPLHALEDVLGQGRDVLGAVAERRDDDPGDVEAVEQVLAEPAGRDLFGQVAVRGRDDAGIGAESLGPTDALELPLLEDAEDLGLGRRGQLAHLVEEDGAAGRTLEPAGLLAVGSGEGTALVAEELALDQALGQRTAIDPDEGTGRAVRVAVQGGGDQFLTGATLADDQDRGVGRGSEADRP